MDPQNRMRAIAMQTLVGIVVIIGRVEGGQGPCDHARLCQAPDVASQTLCCLFALQRLSECDEFMISILFMIPVLKCTPRITCDGMMRNVGHKVRVSLVAERGNRTRRR